MLTFLPLAITRYHKQIYGFTITTWGKQSKTARTQGSRWKIISHNNRRKGEQQSKKADSNAKSKQQNRTSVIFGEKIGEGWIGKVLDFGFKEMILTRKKKEKNSNVLTLSNLYFFQKRLDFPKFSLVQQGFVQAIILFSPHNFSTINFDGK